MSTITQYDAETRERLGIDRVVTGFRGAEHRIVQPAGTPKAREECQPFTFELVSGDRADVKAQEKFVKGLTTLLARQARAEARRQKAAAKARRS